MFDTDTISNENYIGKMRTECLTQILFQIRTKLVK